VLSTFAAAFLALGGVAGLGFQVTHSTETLAGAQAPTNFLVHWQQVASESGHTPAGRLRAWSGVAGAPTRLPLGPTPFRIDRAVAGHPALVWVFNETVGIATSAEIEINFGIHYMIGLVSHFASITVYIETQRTAPAGTISFIVYWDSGRAAGVSFVDQREVAQVCPAVGTCP
jgi:hypothetical protein